jgi:pimeloyl-ACP methyl ester carboxylesterase
VKPHKIIMEYTIGIILALVISILATIVKFDRERAFYPAVMIVIASYYGLFAVMGGSVKSLAIEQVMSKSAINPQPTNSTKQSFLWRWTKRILMGISGAVIVLLISGLVFQYVATRLDERKYPAPGKMVEVGGYRLHLNCTGEGSPAVIMDAGLNGGVLDWVSVQPEIAKFTRVCSYDRAGNYWSETSPNRRTSSQMVKELHTLLLNAGIQAPYVLVGHSVGGANMQLYAGQFPTEVAGMVLVDSSHAEQRTRLPEKYKPPAMLPFLTKVFAPIGVARLINSRGTTGPETITPLTAPERIALSSSTKSLYAFANELALIETSFREVGSTPMTLGDKPLMVLTRGKKEPIPGMTEEETNLTRQGWQELQAELARSSSAGKQIMAEKSGHYIQFEQPELVIESVRQVVELARR